MLALGTSWYLPPRIFAFLFLVTAACDGFSQETGQLVGRVKLAPHLARAYVLYSCIAIATTSLNWLLVERLAVPHHLAWLACISTTGAINLLALKPMVFGQRADRGRG
jgi:hypothetical protein